MHEPFSRINATSIHLLAIGNELLNAETRDSNLFWLIKRLTLRGGRVLRADIVPDDFRAIADEIREAQEKKIDLLITTGGLGPTDDDATLAAIADALGRPLLLDPTALGMVKARIRELSEQRHRPVPRMTRERKSMAMFPEGSIAVHNPVGVAPGMLLRGVPTTIISLPGVPSEMKGIVSLSLNAFWKEMFRGVVYVKRNIVIRGIPEAELAPFMRKAGKHDPGVYIKSRLRSVGIPGHKGRLPWSILLHFSMIAGTREEGLARIEKLIEFISEDLKRKYKPPFEIA